MAIDTYVMLCTNAVGKTAGTESGSANRAEALDISVTLTFVP